MRHRRDIGFVARGVRRCGFGIEIGRVVGEHVCGREEFDGARDLVANRAGKE